MGAHPDFAVIHTPARLLHHNYGPFTYGRSYLMTSIYTTSLTFTSTSKVNGTNANNNDAQTAAGSFDALLGTISSATSQSAAKPAASDNQADHLLRYIQQMMSNTQDFLMNIGSDMETRTVSDASNPFAVDTKDSFVTGDGPLPAFLAKVDVQYNLNDTQKQSLRAIALQFRDANKTPDTLQQISEALHQAGIGVPAKAAEATPGVQST